ncbi:L,D-transpeptidase family protein [Actinomadura flavalba]|uniref:L,D-transpeptidase family protein n=1 Tax=Actinomadura flavalba TaxID=1120938 RepID=UPI000360DE5C|nr:L,D-transpeptidase family protein [Actinomadura flavalba]
MGFRGSVVVVVLPVAVLAAGCEEGVTSAGDAPSSGAPSRSAPPSSPAPPPRLKNGSEGAYVKVLQRRLAALKYDPGKADGRFGTSTRLAVWAFQRVNGLPENGVVTGRVWRALDDPKAPKPVSRKRSANRVDVDLGGQYLVVYRDGRPRLITHVSSGSGEYFCSRDPGATAKRCRYATTGTGDFRTGRRASGWEVSPLGRLYNPVYFNGGIAFHGALDVPRRPASHGCVRMPMHIAAYFPKIVGDDVPVHVRK